MPGLDDIAKNGFGDLKDYSADLPNRPGQKLDAYSRELNNKTLNKLDAAKNEFEAKTINKLEAKADQVFTFVLEQFGLQQLKVNEFKPGEQLEPKDSASKVDGFRRSDKGVSNMHSAEDGKPPMSILGTPIFADVILSNTKRVDYTLAPEQQTESVHLLWCLCEVNQTKNIVKTKVQGRDGDVKEYISDGDYMVTLRGAFSNTFMQSYPKEMVKRLIKMCKIKSALKVTSEYLLMFDIYELVVEDYKFSQEEGKQNIQKFELSCSSDSPLILNKKRNVSNR